jgi:hypothetical protein
MCLSVDFSKAVLVKTKVVHFHFKIKLRRVRQPLELAETDKQLQSLSLLTAPCTSRDVFQPFILPGRHQAIEITNSKGVFVMYA